MKQQNKGSMLVLAAMAMATTTTIHDPYSGLEAPTYSGSEIRRKTNLTKKQKKARVASKRAQKARRRQRR